MARWTYRRPHFRAWFHKARKFAVGTRFLPGEIEIPGKVASIRQLVSTLKVSARVRSKLLVGFEELFFAEAVSLAGISSRANTSARRIVDRSAVSATVRSPQNG